MSASEHSGLIRRTGVATLTAVVLVAIVYLAATWVGDDLVVAPEFGGGAAEPLPLGIATVVTGVGGALGGLLARLSYRFTRRPRLVFLAACVVGLILYGTLAFARAETTTTALWLNAMHVAAAVPIVGALWLWLPVRSSAGSRLSETTG